MAFLERNIILYLDCNEVASAEWGDDVRSMIARDGNIYLARKDRGDNSFAVSTDYFPIMFVSLIGFTHLTPDTTLLRPSGSFCKTQ